MNITRPTVMEVDIQAFKHNVEQIQKYVGEKITLMPVIKANAYGTWINKNLDAIRDFSIVAVATVDEAILLRNDGFENEIFLLNQPDLVEIPKILEYNLTVGVCESTFIEALGKTEKNVKVHIEIETGMGRTGVMLEKLEKWIKLIQKYSHIKVEGMYTHLSSADIDVSYTHAQLSIFEEAKKIVEKDFPNLKYIHTAASNGILNFKQGYYNLVRPGMLLYGYPTTEDTLEKLDLKPVCKLKSKITFLKQVEKGTSIGYSRAFQTQRKTIVATVPIGYADGMKRCLSNKTDVVLHGKRVPVIGNICMDSLMIDVTDLPDVHLGDTVYIWDNDKITLEEVADKCGTITYEIISTISERVPRVFLNSI